MHSDSLKHQINVLRTLDTSEKRSAFLDQMEEELRSYTVRYKTGNAVADTILTGKSTVCSRHGIEFHCVVDGQKLAFMEPADICSLLGNALDNAIEYEQMLPVKEKRLIDVAIFAQKSLLIMKFTNYFEGDLELQDGMPVTTKEKKEYHGFGMKSIRLTAEKYGGTMGFEVQNNWFCLKVLIPIPDTWEAV